MCKDAVATAGALMTTIEPTFKQFLTLENVPTAEQTTAIAAWDAAKAAVLAWTPGTPGTEVIQLLNDFDQVFNTLPFPSEDQELASLILAGITGVIAVITANEPAEVSVTHAATVAHEATLKIRQSVPEVKKIDLRNPEKASEQYNELWAAKMARLHPVA